MDTKQDISQMVAIFLQTDEEWKKAKKAVEETYKIRSAAVKALFDNNTGSDKKKLRIVIDGQTKSLTICKRGDSYFVRGLDDEDDSQTIVVNK